MNKFQIFGDIAADKYYDSDVTPQMVADFFAKATGDVTIELNSNGGSVTAGIAIANMIRDYGGGKTTCKVLGIAASMASVIACAADELKMGTGSFLMVHNPWTTTWGNADELRKDADTLDKLRDAMLQFYSTKFTISPEEMKDMMRGETWIAAEHAAEFHLNCSVEAEEFRAAAHLTRAKFEHVPDGALPFLGEVRDAAAKKDPETPDWEARFKGASRKINELQAALAASGEANLQLTQDLDGARKDLAAAQAKASELEGEIVKAKASLAEAQGELAQTRDSLQAATSEIEDLKAKRTLLTAGVLSPAPDQSYEAKMKAAQTPEEREALRAQKREGKIK